VTLPVLNEIVREWQRGGRAPATINKRLASLRRAFVLGRDAKKVAALPAFPRLPEQNARQGFCDWPSFLALLGALPDDGLRDYVEWSARTGMRKAEAARLTWAGYDRETGVVRLPGKDAKTGEPRRIVLAGPLQALIARRIEARKEHPECALIFHRAARAVLEFRKSWATACKAAGLEGLRFHDLRRVAIRNMVRAGVSQTVAMRISGHKTDSVFRRYDITSDDDLRHAMERTAAYLDELPDKAKVAPIRKPA
jgi:integrase